MMSTGNFLPARESSFASCRGNNPNCLGSSIISVSFASGSGCFSFFFRCGHMLLWLLSCEDPGRSSLLDGRNGSKAMEVGSGGTGGIEDILSRLPLGVWIFGEGRSVEVAEREEDLKRDVKVCRDFGLCCGKEMVR